LKSGGSGRRPSENFAQVTPGPPWQFVQPRDAKACAPVCIVAGSSIEIGGIDCMPTDRRFANMLKRPGNGAQIGPKKNTAALTAMMLAKTPIRPRAFIADLWGQE
jgi:hypothetical protein